MSEITVSIVKNTDEEAKWNSYVAQQPAASGYHQMEWRHLLAKVFGHRTIYFMAKNVHGEVRGILPLVFLASPLFGRFLVSLPYFNYGGLVSDSPEAIKCLLASAQTCALSLGAAYIELRHEEGLHIDLPNKQHKVSMRLDLPRHHEDLMKSFSPKLRAQIRRGEKEGMTAEVGGVSLLDDFYSMFSRNMRDLGTPVYTKQFFAEILKSFPKDTAICAIKHAGKPMAAGFVYGFREKLEIPWAASDRRYARFAPNMMLYGSVLKHACDQGYRVFDFGRSTIDSGTYRFKQQWGAKPVQLQWHYWLHNGQQLPELNPQNPKYKLAIEIWKRLPLYMTTVLGPRISKYLP